MDTIRQVLRGGLTPYSPAPTAARACPTPLDALRAPKALPARLSIAPQTATALLRDWQGRGVAREVTGRGGVGHAVSASGRAMAVPLPERRQCRAVSR